MALSADDVAEVNASLDRAFEVGGHTDGVAVAYGAGVKVTVHHGHLLVSDGIGPRRERTFPRAGTGRADGLRRLVVQARSGYMTLEAVRWCHDLGVELAVLTDEDEVAMASVESKADGRLHRAQAAAGLTDDHPTGVAVVRALLGAKLAGQAQVAERLGDHDAATTVADIADALGTTGSIEPCRQLEATAAAVYWQAWAANPATVPRFRPSDRAKLPSAWATFDGRRSLISGGNSNRRASHPTNAIVNYLAALAKTAAVRASLIVGLDPDMGLLHLDAAGRPSLALDLIEPLRPELEGYVLDLLASRTFRRTDFMEQPDGSVRLGFELRQELAATRPRWDRSVAPWAERTAHMIAELVATGYRPTQPLTRAANRDAAKAVKARKAASGAARVLAAKQAGTRRTKQAVLSLWACPNCGQEVKDPRRVRCEDCIAADPRQAPALRKSRAKAISARRQAEAGWSAKHHRGVLIDPTWARETLCPALVKVPISQVVTATGVAKSTVSGWRNGRCIPHPMHWGTLAELAGLDPADLAGAHTVCSIDRCIT